MKKFKSVAILIVTLLFSVSTYAQKNYYKEAETALKNSQYFAAIDLYKKAASSTKDKKVKADCYFKLGECYKRINNYKQAQSNYDKAVKANHPNAVARLYLADMLKAQEDYAGALSEYQKYSKEVPSDPRGPDGEKSCQLAQQWKSNPTRYQVENMQQINTKDWDYAPSYADKKYTTLIFSSTRDGALGGEIDVNMGELFADLFTTTVDKKGKWSTPVTIGDPVCTKFNEAASVFNGKYNTMYFTRCETMKKQQVKCQLWEASKKGNGYGDVKKIEFIELPNGLPYDSVINYNFGHPTVDDKETLLIFAADLPGGQGGLDIWYSVYDKKAKKWGKPVNAGPTINTRGDEAFPSLRENGDLYFASTGHLGMGGYDIFKSVKKGEYKWENVENMQFPINSAGDDFAIIWEGKEDRGYFTSNRTGGKGADDIYSFIMPPILFTLKGYVTEKDTKLPIEGAIVKLLGSDGSSEEVKTDKTGYYEYIVKNADMRYINAKTSYVASASGLHIQSERAKKGYLGNPKGQFTTIGVSKSTDFRQDFELTLIKAEIRMPLVLFNLDKYDLLHPSNPKDSLEFLYQTLIDNPTITVELGAHTDARNTAAYNKKLSFNRANTCVEYIISKGIAADRIKPTGYGEDKPKVLDSKITLPSGTTVDSGTVLVESFINKYKGNKADFEFLHQINRRVVFSVLRTDYVPKEGVKKDEFPKIEINASDNEGGNKEGDADLNKNTKMEIDPNTGTNTPKPKQL